MGSNPIDRRRLFSLMVEHWPCKPEDAGSSPVRVSLLLSGSSLTGKMLRCDRKVMGSSPIFRLADVA